MIPINKMSGREKHKSKKIIFWGLALLACGVVVYYTSDNFSPIIVNEVQYSSEVNNIINDKTEINSIAQEELEPVIKVTHIMTPEIVKALYMSSWVAGSKDFLNSLIKIVDETELNAVVIDIKDSTGRVSFEIDNPLIKEIGSVEHRIKDINSLIELLHSKNIYVIGRISVFQDPYLTKLKPEWSLKKISDGTIWKDKKGLSFLDPTSEEVENYIITLAKESYKSGFDEINFDYIRYPSDGVISDINYNLEEGKTRTGNIEKFFKKLSLGVKEEEDIPISGDVFGLTTEATDDMGIGQVWERAAPYFDFLCPMVYPSHYPSGHMGYTNPALYPYEVINQALQGAITKNKLMDSPKIAQIRPWLQDFDLGAVYTADMVKEEIKAVYDNNLNSWMLWDPSNKYTPSALGFE